MNFLCPACRTPLPRGMPADVVSCSGCGVDVDVSRVETAPGAAPLRAEVDLEATTLSGYRLGKRLGAGGMGVVYEATGPHGACAVKVLAAQLAADPALRSRFRREAAALRSIAHPNVVRVLADGEERGFSWYSMERVDGADLRKKIQASPLPFAEVETIARKLLSALDAVHARGLVHRDVKPGNVLLTASGEPKLCDFGIAQVDGATTLTASAAIIGSLRYMAPEQRRGAATAQSDLYSLGLTLYEALAGGTPDERDLPKGTPRRLRKLLAAMTQERAAMRATSAGAASRILNERSVSRGVALGGVGAAAAIVLALVVALRPSEAPVVAQAKSPPPAPAPAPNVAAIEPRVKEGSKEEPPPDEKPPVVETDKTPEKKAETVKLPPRQATTRKGTPADSGLLATLGTNARSDDKEVDFGTAAPTKQKGATSPPKPTAITSLASAPTAKPTKTETKGQQAVASALELSRKGDLEGAAKMYRIGLGLLVDARERDDAYRALETVYERLGMKDDAVETARRREAESSAFVKASAGKKAPPPQLMK